MSATASHGSAAVNAADASRAGALDAYLAARFEHHLAQLAAGLAIPSVSALPEHAGDVRRCAAWVADALGGAGLEHVRVIDTPGHPIVYGDWLHAPGAPTVLIYGHYDVQPVEPVDAWTTPPFAPTVRDGKLFARGATDDKGQFFIHVAAIEAHLAVHGRLPVNVKVLIEGEEEVGCTHLRHFVRAERASLAAAVVVDSDNAMFARDTPSLAHAMRGIACFRLDVRSAARDLHSGSFGGGVANPAQALATLLAALRDGDGRVTIPGFYDDVRPPDDAERAALAALPFDEAGWLAALGLDAGAGERGFTTLERLWTRPALDVNGLASGFAGPGFKTVLPASATATLSVRLVPDQDPVRIGDLLAAHVEVLAATALPRGAVRVTLTRLHHGAPYVLRADDPWLAAAARAFAHGFGRAPVLTREGGSNPVVSVFRDALGAPTILFGIGLPDENPHAPDEHLDLDNFRRGVRAAARLYQELAACTSSRGRESLHG